MEVAVLAHLGRLVVRYRWLVVGLWAVVLVAGVTVGGRVFSHLHDADGTASAESVRGMKVLDAERTRRTDLLVVVSSRTSSARPGQSSVDALAHRLTGLPFVTRLETSQDMADSAAMRSNTVVLSLETRPTADMMRKVDEVDTVRRMARHTVPGARVEVAGDLAVMRDQMATSEHDLVAGEIVSLPLLLIALFFVFRGWRPALLPLGAALATVTGALLALLAATRFVDVAGDAVDVAVLFGLALAVDYSLLMVSRFREQRASGSSVEDAVVGSVATAGRTIVFSALTVTVALAGLFLFGNPTFTSLAIGGIATVLVALAAGLTLTPALTTVWGPKIAVRAARDGASTGFFWRVAHVVQRRPLVTAGLTSAVLVAMALPFLGAHFSSGDYRVLPTSVESRRATDTMVNAFPSMSTEPIEVVIPDAPARADLTGYVRFLRGVPGVRVVTLAGVGSSPVALVEVVPRGAAQGATARRVVEAVRSRHPGFPVLVTGSAAALVDFQHQVTTRLPYALAWLAVMTMLLLFLMTGSVLVPVKAVVMNVLSLGATFGALTWVFQDGHLAGVLHFQGTGTIEVWVPILVFLFGFGLSMDYEVFLLSRIKESFDASGDSDHAVADGLQRSGRIITSAAVLVGIVFLGFAAGDNLGIKEMGLALAVAVLVDATLVRCVLVPSTMTLLGDLNWWAPPALRRVYERVGLHESPVLPTPAAEDKPREAITLEV